MRKRFPPPSTILQPEKKRFYYYIVFMYNLCYTIFIEKRCKVCTQNQTEF